MSANDVVDHLLLGVADRELGVRWFEERTGVRAAIGGSHPGLGTWNALLSLGGRQYLEIIAPDPAQGQLAPQYRILSTLATPRLFTWAAVTHDADATAARCRAAGLDVIGPDPGARQRPDGQRLQWSTVRVTTDVEILIPFFIEWGRTVTHPSVDSPQGCRLEAVTFAHPKPEHACNTLARMGIDATVMASARASLTARLHTPNGLLELQ